MAELTLAQKKKLLEKLERLEQEDADDALKLAKVKKAEHAYVHENKIEFFGVRDEVKAGEHAMCCKLFRGANPMQAELLGAWEKPEYKVFTFTGSNRIGKTTIGAVIAICMLAGEWLWNGKKIRFSHSFPRKVRYVGQDWEKHIKAVVEPELKKWWPKQRPVKTKKNNFGVDSVWIDEKTGSVLEIMSNNQSSDLHEGWSGDLIIYDEPPKRDIRVANARGLVDRCGRELFCMTLLKEAWVDREVIKALNEDGTPDTSVFNVHGDINVNIGFGITREGVDQFAKTLTEEEKDARLKGIPSYMSGLVYPDFKRHVHLKKRFKIPTNWIVDIRVDVHPRERQAVLFVATDPRGYRYACYEIWEHGTAEDIAHEIVRVVISNGYRVNSIKVDPLSKGDKNNENTVFDRINDVLVPHGLVAGVACKDKTAGILAVKEHLKGPNGEPSLWIFDDLKRTIFEIEGYMYDEDTQKPCVVGGTVIDTPTGQFQIKDLVGKELYVYTYSHKHGRINVCKATNIRKTKESAEVWRLTTDGGSIFATPDHKIMLRNGEYKELKDLKPYESLMPLYRTVGVDGYTKINPNDHRSLRGGKYPGEHRLVYECFYGEIPEGKEIHHIDFNYRNHVPENLLAIDSVSHQLIHAQQNSGDVECFTCGKMFRQNVHWQKHCSTRCRQKNGDSRRGRAKQDRFCAYCGKPFAINSHPQKYCSITCRGYAFRERRQSLPSYNHKVISVEFYGYEDVYDMTVDEDHNFVANGIIVHNCDSDDHMMENLYRVLVDNPQWSDMADVEDELEKQRQHRNKVTGY